MNKCLVTVLDAKIENSDFLAQDEFSIKVHPHKMADGNPVPSEMRWLNIYYWSGFSKIKIRSSQNNTVKMYSDAACTVIWGNENGEKDNIVPNTNNVIYFPIVDGNGKLLEDYEIIFSNKFNLGHIIGNEGPIGKFDFFEINLKDLKYCPSLYDVRLRCHIMNGDLADLALMKNFNYLNCCRTNFAGDIAALENNKSLMYFKANYSDIYGDISVIKDLPYLRNFEIIRDLGIYGNVEAFENHKSINYLVFPCAAGHPCIEGDIASFANCTSLVRIEATNERNLTGSIEDMLGTSANPSALSKVMTHCLLNGTSVYGNVSALKNSRLQIQQIALGNSFAEQYHGSDDPNKKVSGELSGSNGLLDINKPMERLNYLDLSYSGIAGSSANLANAAPNLSTLILSRTKVSGDISDFYKDKLENLTNNLNLFNCVNIGGEITDDAQGFNENLANLNLSGISAKGRLSYALNNCSNLTTLNVTYTLFEDDVTELFANKPKLVNVSAVGCINMSGNLANLPNHFTGFTSGGIWDAVYSWSSLRSSDANRLFLMNVNLGNDVEKMLVSQACLSNNDNKQPNNKTIQVFGKFNINTTSNLVKNAISILKNKGYTITINSVVVSYKNDTVDPLNANSNEVKAFFGITT